MKFEPYERIIELEKLLYAEQEKVKLLQGIVKEFQTLDHTKVLDLSRMMKRGF